MLVVLGDVDAAGVVYFPRAFHWHEREFTTWLAESGTPLQSILESGRGLPIRHSEADYRGGVRLGDELEVRRTVTDVAATEFMFRTAWHLPGAAKPAITVATQHVSCQLEDGVFVRTSLWDDVRRALADHT